MTHCRKNVAPRLTKDMGFSLIEVLVTIVILLIGLLGLAGLQGRALTSQMESYQRSQALILLKDMADRIDANRNVASCYAVSNAPGGISLGTGTLFSSIATPAACTGQATAFSADNSSNTTSYCTAAGVCSSVCTLSPTAAAASCPDATSQATSQATAKARAVQGIPTVLSDLQTWHNALMGSAEILTGANVGAMIGARGCVYQVVAPSPGIAAQYLVVVAWQGMNNTYAPDVTTATSMGQCGLGQYKDKSGATVEALHRVIALPVSVADLQ